MKVNIETLQDTFRYGYEQYERSRIESQIVWDLYHNRQYSIDQLSTLSNRSQPAETFNVVKLFARMLMGYFSTTVNELVVNPVQESDLDTSLLLNDVVQQIFKPAQFEAEGDKMKLSGLISGLMVAYEEVIDTGKKDKYGRPIYKVQYSHVPEREVVPDPSSGAANYSDADWIHRYKWIHEDLVVKTFGQAAKDKLDAYDNHIDQTDTEFEAVYNGEFVGKYRIYDNYLIVHTVMIDDDDQRWSVFWSGDVELQRTKLTANKVKFPYRIQKVHTSDIPEYYGIFREVIETQKAINQALTKFQLLANTQKVFVQEGAVEDIANFTDAFNRVSGVIEVTNLKGVKIVDLSREALQQYDIINKALDRIQRVLSVNDSFLGLAQASDSGRKVKLQKSATITALRYLTNSIEQFYTNMGMDAIYLVQQYYTANQVIRIADETVGFRWSEINKPLEIWNGEYDETGAPIMETQFEEVTDPETGEPLIVDGNFVIAPIPEAGTEIAFTEVDIEINAVAFDDTDEKNQLMLEGIISGNAGQLLSQVNPSGYMNIVAKSVRNMKTKNSPEIAKIFEDTATALGGDKDAEAQASGFASGNPDASSQLPSSQEIANG